MVPRITAACRLRRIRASAQSQRVYESYVNLYYLIIRVKLNGWPSASRGMLDEMMGKIIAFMIYVVYNFINLKYLK